MAEFKIGDRVELRNTNPFDAPRQQYVYTRGVVEALRDGAIDVRMDVGYLHMIRSVALDYIVHSDAPLPGALSALERERAALDEQCRHCTTSFFKTRFDHNTLCRPFCYGLQIHHLGLQ